MANWKTTLKTLLFIIGAAIAINFFEVYGLVGFIIFLLILVLYRLIKSRESLMTGIRNMETMIFGKPLDRDIWDKGELKDTKIKFSIGQGRFKMTKYHFYALGYALLFLSLILLWRFYR